MTSQRWDDICQRWGEQGYGALTRPEKTWLNVRSLIDGVENGGIISYFYNSGAGTVADCLDDLTTLGALGVAEQVRRVSSLFPGSVPADLDDRNRIIDSWPDEGVDRDRIDDLLQDADAVLMPLMADLEAKLASFLEASELAT